MPSGGARPNTGGARPGAGRKPKPTVPTTQTDAVEFLSLVMQGVIEPSTAQLDAAKALARLAGDNKKAQRQKAAEAVAGGKFGAAEPPRLVVSNN